MYYIESKLKNLCEIATNHLNKKFKNCKKMSGFMALKLSINN